jgi:hypothetical protein
MPILLHIIPLFRVLVDRGIRFEMPGIDVADTIAEAIRVFFANCLLFILSFF